MHESIIFRSQDSQLLASLPRITTAVPSGGKATSAGGSSDPLRATPVPFPARYLLTPSLKRLPVSGKCAFFPREKEKPNGRPVAPVPALFDDRSFARPPGCESTNAVASTTNPPC